MRHEYELIEKVEAGLVLTGTEVKSLRNGKASLEEAYAEVDRGEAWLLGCDIPEYLQANRMNHVPKRPRSSCCTVARSPSWNPGRPRRE